MSTIADIRRGDRFTWDGRTWLALDDARVTTGEPSYDDDASMSVLMIETSKIRRNASGAILSEAGGQWKGIRASAPVDIKARGLDATCTMDDIPRPDPDTAPATRDSIMGHLRWIEESRQMTRRALDDLDETRDVRIRQAIAAGVSVPDLMAATGLSRARIYQIRDNRR